MTATWSLPWLVMSTLPPPPAAPPPMPPGGGAVPPPPPAHTEPPPVQATPPPKKKWSWLWWLLGCGCLLAILVLTGSLGLLHLFQGTIQRELHIQRPPMPPVPGTAVTRPYEQKTTVTPAAKAEPGERAAMQAALVGHNGWIGKVTYKTLDWRQVKVLIGPPGSEPITSVMLKWEAKEGAYRVESMYPLHHKRQKEPGATPTESALPKRWA